VSDQGVPIGLDAARRMVRAVKQTEGLLHAKVGPPPIVAEPRGIEHWVQLTSTTPVGGRYPGQWYLRDASAGTCTAQTDPAQIDVVLPNGETPATGTFYRAFCSGVDGAGNLEFVAVVPAAGETVLTVDGFKWRAGGGGPIKDYFAGIWQMPPSAQWVAGFQVPASGTIYFLPVLFSRASQIVQLALFFSAATTGTGKIRLGVYQAAGTQDVHPQTLIADAGDFTPTAGAGLKGPSLTAALARDTLYWIAMMVDATMQASATRYYGFNTDGYAFPILGTTIGLTLPTPCFGYSGVQAYGALPANTTGLGGSSMTHLDPATVPQMPLIAYELSG
jgi:hypothetical protein